jgi:hypothetical protein
MTTGSGITHISIAPRGIRAFCSRCGTERFLPEDWKVILVASMSAEEARDWDGQLRCVNGHAPLPMTVTEASNGVV